MTTPTSDAHILMTPTISRVVLMSAEEWALVTPSLVRGNVAWDSLLVLKTLLPVESANLVIPAHSLSNSYLMMLAQTATEQFATAQQDRLSQR